MGSEKRRRSRPSKRGDVEVGRSREGVVVVEGEVLRERLHVVRSGNERRLGELSGVELELRPGGDVDGPVVGV